jgi:peptidoglycan-associated lipoprotein
MPFRETSAALMVGSLVLASATACATKGFVRNQIGNVDTKVETLSQSIEATQESTRQNQARIAEVDKKTDQVGLWAKDAQSTATVAQSTATQAQNAAAAAGDKAAAVEVASRRLVLEVVISEDQGNFKFGSAELPDAAKVRIDEMVAQLKADPRGNFVEIEGHTDSIGDAAVNQRIGEARAEAVKRYLYEHHEVPLHKINVISYGAEKPLAPNNTKQGRAQNRRVVIKVLV